MPLNFEQIFREARYMSADKRDGYLKGSCGDDLALRAKVEGLLRADAEDITASVTPVNREGDGAAGADATVADPAHERAGEMIGRYKLLQQIGEGGMGTVWMAEQREPVKRRVALKVIKLGMDTKEVIARFEAERQALAMMDHPNIAKVLDAGATEMGRPFFVMELVKGVPIMEYCDTEKLDTKARLDLFIQVCNAIQHAHQKGIIHRDITPNNVMITLHDGVPVPKVIDFGVAKATNQELTEKTLFTQHRQIIGTPAYMSPEQAEMTGFDIDTRSDIYSLGVLLYELLTGTTPFTNEELLHSGFAKMMWIIREAEPPKPSTRLSTLGETLSRTAELRRVADPKKLGLILRGDLDWIVMRCLEKDRSRRYDTANGLAADILRHLNNDPVSAGPPSKSYKFGKFMKRNRGQVIAGGLVAAALVLGIAGTTGGMLWAMDQTERAKEAEAATQLELTRTTEVKRLITEMLSGIDPAKAQGADTVLLRGILDEAAERLIKGEVKDELIAAELHSVVGNVYGRLGLAPRAEQHLPVAAEIGTRLLGEEHPVTLSYMYNLAILYSDQGRYAEALSLNLKTLDVSKRVLGEEHPDTLRSMNNLGNLYEDLSRFPEALALARETVEISKRVFGTEHQATLMFTNNLSNRVGAAEALSLRLGTLEIQTRVLGEEHPDTLMSMHNLAARYRVQGRYAEALALCLKTLAIKTRVLGEEHPTTLESMNNLATLYKDQGRYAEALSLHLKTLDVRKRLLGEEHHDTLRSMSNIGYLYSGQGRYAEALPWYLKTLEIQTRVLGEAHQETLWSMINLANVHSEQRRYAEAESLYLKTLEIRTRVLGEEHLDTLESMKDLANLYSRQGRYAEALSLHLKTLEDRNRVLGEEHLNTLGSMTDLANLYNLMERYEDSAKMFETSLRIKRRVLGKQHPLTGLALKGLADAYTALGRPDDALPLYRELHELQLAAANEPEASSNTLNEAARTLLTNYLPEQKDPARALVLATRACTKEESNGGGFLWIFLDTLALAQHQTGDNAAAVMTQRRAISLTSEATDEAQLKVLTTSLHAYEAALEAKEKLPADGG